MRDGGKRYEACMARLRLMSATTISLRLIIENFLMGGQLLAPTGLGSFVRASAINPAQLSAGGDFDAGTNLLAAQFTNGRAGTPI